MDPDSNFSFDPVCRFASMIGTWVRRAPREGSAAADVTRLMGVDR